LRENPAWGLLDYPGTLMNRVWKEAARIEACRRIYDVRLAFTLRHYGVTEFATANIKDFKDFGFERVWNPLKDTASQ
jgi:predicted nucleic acid-binding protein